MSETARTRFAPLSGVVAVVLLISALIVEGQPPAADAGTEEVLRYHSEHDARLVAATALGCLAAAFLIWFGGSVFAALRRTEREPGRVSMIAFGGFVVAGAGLAMLFGLVLAAAETVGEVPAEVTQSLSVLSALFVTPFAVGMLVTLLASAVVILRDDALPRWLGYLSIAIAVAFMASMGLGTDTAIVVWILAGAAWVAICSVVLVISDLQHRS